MYEPSDVRQSAVNSVNYLATKFAFQSIRGKRAGPMRRKYGTHEYLSFYQEDGLALTFSFMTGAYEWDDCTNLDVYSTPPNIGRPKCPVMYYEHSQRGLLPAMLGASSQDGYRIPSIIARFMFKRGPFFARMKPKYTIKHYKPASGWLNVPEPDYFVDHFTAFSEGRDESSPELYFGDDQILMSAGGRANRYYSVAWDASDPAGKAKKKYHSFSKPTMLITRGDYGQTNWIDPFTSDDWEWGRSGRYALRDARRDVLLSPGKVWDWFESECNVWVYHNFVYGYKYHDRGAYDGADAPVDFSKGHAFDVPEFWDTAAYATAEFSIGNHAHFTIHEFEYAEDMITGSAAPHITYSNAPGYYIVRARLRKSKAGYLINPSHREFARGFIEIIPRNAVGDIVLLEALIRAWNPPTNFSGRIGLPWLYVLATSRELLTLDDEMGAKWGGYEECDNGIKSIWKYNNQSGHFDIHVDMNTWFIPPNVRDSDSMKELPLITVWKLDSLYEPTGWKYVRTVTEGGIYIQNRRLIPHATSASGCQEIAEYLRIDSSDYTNPFETSDLSDQPDCTP